MTASTSSFDLAAGAVGAFFDARRQTDNFRGSVVTIPHKQDAADMSKAQLQLVGPWWGLEVPPDD